GVFGLSRDTIAKMCRFSVPPGYQRSKPLAKPKLGPLTPVIDAILEADRSAPGQAAPHGQADFRAATGRIRICRRLYGGEGLRPPEADADEGGVRASGASARARPGGFWPVHRHHWRGAHGDARLL